MGSLEKIKNATDRLYEAGQEKILLHLDLLGFKDIVQSNPLRVLVEEVNKSISKTIELTKTESNSAWAKPEYGYSPNQPPIQGHLWFSDTLIFYSKDASAWALATISEFAREFVSRLLVLGLPVRGSIVCGPFHISKQPEGSFVGEALIYGYELEKKQEWCGVILHPQILQEQKIENVGTIIELLNKIGTITEYYAPLKDGLMQKFLCVNWPQKYMELTEPKDLFQHMTTWTKVKATWSAFRKIQNTKRFLDKMLDSDAQNIS